MHLNLNGKTYLNLSALESFTCDGKTGFFLMWKQIRCESFSNCGKSDSSLDCFYAIMWEICDADKFQDGAFMVVCFRQCNYFPNNTKSSLN